MPKGSHLKELNKKRRKNYVGQKFCKLTVLEDDGMVNKGHAYKCLCECGNIRRQVNGYELKRGVINSCGCDFPAGHFRERKSDEEYFEHVKRELISKRNIVNDCWEFTGQIDRKGYGRRTFTIKGKKQKKPVHQIAYILWKGEIPKNLFVCHSCDNRKCFNPDHLWVGTQKENLQDMTSKGRGVDHKGENHPKTKFKKKDILEIRKMYSEGKKVSEISKLYNQEYNTVWCIVKHKNWKHI